VAGVNVFAFEKKIETVLASAEKGVSLPRERWSNSMITSES
jgi:hypothetical protein